MRPIGDLNQLAVHKIRIKCRIRDLEEEQMQVLRQLATLKKAKWYELQKHLRWWWLQRGLADLERLVVEYKGDLLEMGDAQIKKEFFYDKFGKRWMLRN